MLSLSLGLALACTAGSGDTEPDPRPTEPAVRVSPRCEDISRRPNGVVSFYEDNPTYEDGDTVRWAEASPSEAGLDPALLDEAAEYLMRRPYVDSFLVVRGGALVYERYFQGTQPWHSQNVHSSSKSLLGAVTGVAVAEGVIDDIDDAVADYLPALFEEVDDPDKHDITVRHLLTMSAGFEWTEDVDEYWLEENPDWLRAILRLPMEAAPGEVFNYSSAQTHLLAAVIAEASGMSYCDYLHARLLEPMGVQAEHMGRDPQGYFSGGYNLYLTPRELATFGKLTLARGEWEGEQLVPADWMDAAVTGHMDAGGGYEYGYLFWLLRLTAVEVDIAWGYGGQLVYTFPEHDLAVIITTNTHDYEPDFHGTDVLMRYVLPAILD